VRAGDSKVTHHGSKKGIFLGSRARLKRNLKKGFPSLISPSRWRWKRDRGEFLEVMDVHAVELHRKAGFRCGECLNT